MMEEVPNRSNQGVLPVVAASYAFMNARERFDFGVVRICDSDLHGYISRRCLVNSKPCSGECAMTKFMYNLISAVKAVVNMGGMVAARSIFP